MEELNATYFADMYNNLETTFNDINQTLAANREEIKQMAYEVHEEANGDFNKE